MSQPLAPPDGGFQPPPPPPPSPPNRVEQLPQLGLLMMAQGALTLAWFLFCLFGVSVGFINTAIAPHRGDESLFLILGYSAFALGALPVGVLDLWGGYQIRRRRGRIVALVGAFWGVASFLCGNVFCAPTAVALCVYAAIVLFDPAVKRAFGSDSGP